MRECPKKAKVNALVADRSDGNEATTPRVNPLHLFTATQGESRAR